MGLPKHLLIVVAAAAPETTVQQASTSSHFVDPLVNDYHFEAPKIEQASSTPSGSFFDHPDLSLDPVSQ